tara:strand:- start:198 stop:473 length:276 start_codon:yes stop_codon:yes gene_type:complete
MSDENSYNISKKIGNFIGSKCVPIIKVGGYCFDIVYNSISNGWSEFSKEVSPEVEHIKETIYKRTLIECVNKELGVIDETSDDIADLDTTI